MLRATEAILEKYERINAKGCRSGFVTGGGPLSAEPMNAVDSRVLAVVPGKMDPLACQTDSDAMETAVIQSSSENDGPRTVQQQESILAPHLPMTSQQSELLEAEQHELEATPNQRKRSADVRELTQIY